jgi:GYF domain 2
VLWETSQRRDPTTTLSDMVDEAEFCRSMGSRKMPTNWYIVKSDGELGPYTSDQMKSLAASGQLKTDDQVRREDLKSPVAAGKIRGLLPEVQTSNHPTTTCPPLPSERSKSGTASGPPPFASSQTPERPRTTPPPLPSERSKSGTASGPLPLPSSRTKFDNLRKTLGDLTEKTKAAGHLAVAEARRTQLTKITLPAAYLALGRDIFSGGRFRSEFPELYAEIEHLQAEITRLTTGRSEGKPGGTFTEKAAQTASKIKDTAQAKALGIKLDSLMRRLGEVGFDAHKEKSGPESLIQPISESHAKIEVTDEQIRQHLSVSQGRWITPRRVLIGGIVALGLVVLLAVFTKPKASGPGAISTTVHTTGDLDKSDDQKATDTTQETLDEYVVANQEKGLAAGLKNDHDVSTYQQLHDQRYQTSKREELVKEIQILKSMSSTNTSYFQTHALNALVAARQQNRMFDTHDMWQYAIDNIEQEAKRLGVEMVGFDKVNLIYLKTKVEEDSLQTKYRNAVQKEIAKKGLKVSQEKVEEQVAELRGRDLRKKLGDEVAASDPGKLFRFTATAENLIDDMLRQTSRYGLLGEDQWDKTIEALNAARDQRMELYPHIKKGMKDIAGKMQGEGTTRE